MSWPMTCSIVNKHLPQNQLNLIRNTLLSFGTFSSARKTRTTSWTFKFGKSWGGAAPMQAPLLTGMGIMG